MLEKINSPSDIKQLSNAELVELAKEIREFLINNVTATGGHIAANLGTVELTLALYKVFDFPTDSLIWDVGHQTYTHKIITGRKQLFNTLRKKNGISGFTKRDESKYDIFGAGHSSTSISASLGIAIANQINNNNAKTVAIIGDGALTGGMAFEALNHAGDTNADLLIILNDNDMSISKNVGALSKYLTRLLSSKIYSSVREKSLNALNKLPSIQKFAKKSEEHLKGFILPSTLFEELGINYFGPIDGHNINELTKTLNNLYHHSEVRILHIVTKKGKGLKSAEQDPCKFHGISAQTNTNKDSNITYSQVFGNWLCDNAKNNNKLIAITPAMCSGSGMDEFAKKYPQQYFDVGIAEQHAITFAGGLAVRGFLPVVAIYSTFLQRGYDQLIHDIALQNLAVIFAIDRAGLVGEDGATHAGVFDLSFLTCIPNLIIMAPSSLNECYQMLNTAKTLNQPSCIRYPRGVSAMDNDANYRSDKTLEIGKAKIYKTGKDIAILAFGATLKSALVASERLNATVVDMRFVKPLDTKIIINISKTHKQIITIEDNVKQNGAGSVISSFLHNNNIKTPLYIMGIDDKFIAQGSQKEQQQMFNIDAESIIKIATTNNCEKNPKKNNSK